MVILWSILFYVTVTCGLQVFSDMTCGLQVFSDMCAGKH